MNESFLKILIDWFKGQPFSNVMSFLQLAMIAGGLWIGVNVIIPGERKAILEGLEKQEASQTEQIKRISDSFDKALDRAYNRPLQAQTHGED